MFLTIYQPLNLTTELATWHFNIGSTTSLKVGITTSLRVSSATFLRVGTIIITSGVVARESYLRLVYT
jgi:hypothetical protein